LEILPDDLKIYAEIVHSTLNEGPHAILNATNSVVVADVYKRIIGYTDPITGTFISSKSTLINSGNDTGKTKRKISSIRLKFLNVVNSYHDRVFHRA
jgi:hypothetical protein